ncbi:hypothetical protein CAEBREN_22160 [Caenorhabditis brenneri]|uniref:Uncharacterized protein n=1 Tax=Caenorhabditis brenneri TaxID=135651 RepID=G0MF00_CAEBE|nr:hypothetical protein CAEBREN_22160 [Caenorhabditis brenneri]
MEDFNTSLGPAVCRICMCGETSIPYLGKQAGEPLISPCRCSGTMGLFHRSCLEHWLTLTRTTNCEICKFSFKIKQKSRNFIDYIRQKGYKKVRTEPDNRNPFVDISFILVISPLACIALFLCVRGAALAGQKYHFAFENRDNDENGRNLEIRNETSMEFALFVFVAVVLFFSYMIFLVVTLGNHVVQYKKWQAKNKIMFVVDQLDAEQSLHYNPSWKKQNKSWKTRISQAWSKLRGKPIRVLYPEIARNSIQIGRTSTPQMYAEYAEKPDNLALSPIGLDDLFANSVSPRKMSASAPSGRNDMRKSQSVYSVCSSFGTGVTSCSTPVPRKLSPSANSVSTFKSTCSDELEVCDDESEDTLIEESQRGRFHVEKIKTPPVPKNHKY